MSNSIQFTSDLLVSQATAFSLYFYHRSVQKTCRRSSLRYAIRSHFNSQQMFRQSLKMLVFFLPAAAVRQAHFAPSRRPMRGSG
jgi:hypothetical protein